MKTLIPLLTLFLPLFVKAQNFIPNPSFESINYCEANIPCSPSGWYSVSNIPYGYQNNLSKPIKGKHSIAFLIAFEKEIRSYWQTMLLCDLKTDGEYVISFNLYAAGKDFEPRYFGLYFSDTLFRSENDTIIQMHYQTAITNQHIKLLKNGWFKITLPYKANGNEKYLLLGNFDMNANSKIMSTAGNKRFIEYYIDDISLKSANKNSGKSDEYQGRSDSLYATNIRHADFHHKAPVKVVVGDTQNIIRISKSDTLLLGTINFNFDDDKLISTKILNDYFDRINFSTIATIEIIGYTDSVGTQSYNLKLSERRAESVKQHLLYRYKLADSLFVILGKGIIKDSMLLENNRRVEVRVYKK